MKAAELPAITNHLERGDAALGRGDFASALKSLLLAWSEWKSPRLADLIGRVSDEAIAGETQPKTWKARWAAFERTKDKADPIALARIFAPPWPKDAASIRKLYAGITVFEDPRCSAAIAHHLAAGEGGSASLVASAWLDLMTIGDVRVLAVLDAAGWRSDSPDVANRRELLEKLAARRLADLPTKALACLERMEARYAAAANAEAHDEARGAALHAAVLADPTAREPKLVYGDWLGERGDPRGELIALQLRDALDDPAEATPERALVVLRAIESALARRRVKTVRARRS